MKISKGTVLTAVLCVLMSLSAFILPIYASNNVSYGRVVTVETPTEYMADFVALADTPPGARPNLERYMDTIFIDESRISAIKTDTEKMFFEMFGAVVPDEWDFTYWTFDWTEWPNDYLGSGLELGMQWNRPMPILNLGIGDEITPEMLTYMFDPWTDPFTPERFEQVYSLNFSAHYRITGIQGNELVLELISVSVGNWYDEGILGDLNTLAKEALTNETEAVIPEDYRPVQYH
jgi:hypothetical protein